ncbi:MAG: class I SAM-dependent methyltransferase [Acidobacteria bacterium]|nr:class I SAM-dependent methyltransferase [Acidobacteriota bacterium]
MRTRELKERIRRRARQAQIPLSSELADALEGYYSLLAKWNARVNLTAFKLLPGGEDEAVDRLLLEPVAAAMHVPPHAETLLDAGSGGGSPAIPLKLAVPKLRLRMVEVKTRKAVFLREAARELNLTDTVVETSRFEELLSRPELHESTDLVSIRAVRIETKVLMSLQAFLRPGGQLFLFRGPAGTDVSDSVTPPLAWKATFPLVESLRSRLVVLEKYRIG